MKTVGIVACSNGEKIKSKKKNEELVQYLESSGSRVVISNCIYENKNVFSGSGKERANELMRMFTNPEMVEIYDISGGDLANQIIEELDFEAIKRSKAVFWGYSDLTTIINAIYSQTGKSSVLYQVKNMVWGNYTQMQRHRFKNREELFYPNFTMIQGDSMEGIVVGGNIRCFLKLAGTKYFPDLSNKLLLLEACGGEVPQMTTYLSQLKQIGAFKQVKGVLLGTFTTMEEKECEPDIITLTKEFVSDLLPIAKTHEIGHGCDSKAIKIGEKLKIMR